MRILLIVQLLTILSFSACAQKKNTPTGNPTFTFQKTETEWKKILTPEQYNVCRLKGTEKAYTGTYWDNHKKGIYECICCKLPLFSSDTKFESGTGWPSFYQPLLPSSTSNINDSSHGMDRTEVVCSRCGSHLGHVFNDGPKPTGLRYCMNSVSLNFIPKK